jgi:hypothetical protein
MGFNQDPYNGNESGVGDEVLGHLIIWHWRICTVLGTPVAFLTTVLAIGTNAETISTAMGTRIILIIPQPPFLYQRVFFCFLRIPIIE